MAKNTYINKYKILNLIIDSNMDIFIFNKKNIIEIVYYMLHCIISYIKNYMTNSKGYIAIHV